MVLNEIINAPPLPYEWLSETTAKFEFNNVLFGIVLEPFNVTLKTRTISIVNISFGPIINTQEPVSSTNINRDLTNFGSPRTVMSTVAEACTKNNYIRHFDMFVVAASQQITKRQRIYTLAISQISTNLQNVYKFDYRAVTPNNTVLIVSSKVELLQEEVDQVGKDVLGKP